MARTKLVNGVVVQFSAEEEKARDADEAQAVIDKQAEVDAKTALEANKVSGKQKLKDLGLDDEEIKSLMGV